MISIDAERTRYLAKEIGALGLVVQTATEVSDLTTMLETTITLLAIICATCVSAMSLIRWHGAHGFRAAVYLGFAIFAGLVALLNVSALLASGDTFIRTAALAYVGFATAAILPAARALGNVTYEKPDEAEHEDATV